MEEIFTIHLPRTEETVLLQQDKYGTKWRDSFRQTVNKILDPEDPYALQIRELIIASQAERGDGNGSHPDENGIVDIRGLLFEHV